ncbi:23S rRNA (adenine(2503)-C(2))-methyltransferase RlmN [Adlercreutzia sp. R7]|uniref:Probable dual-specificity RNA methyltransferase RlmN n=1 Tax=Adlercreutzia wanghongyangiae TaxID=3111451 RepID=A0ABU6IFP1_9ACTN|nr:23S rRNA (adenine(2503)-C(2))-methyltransferase RlmN [Adlercreutzia sp. R7]
MNNELLKLNLDSLTDLVESWGHPRFRAKQIHQWLHQKHCSSYDEMSNVPRQLRDHLSEAFPLDSFQLFDRQISQDGTRKYVFQLHDNRLVETVGMPSFGDDGTIERLTVCVSSQVGCPMKCSFCATGKEGFTRNLTASELVQQVAAVQNDFNSRVSNIVVMGQGEPFLNYEEVLAALQMMNSDNDFNIAARRITVSTCGLITGIERFSREPEQFTLAVSLHAAIQDTRDLLMPQVAHQPLPQLKQALSDYIAKTNRRVTLEYLLIRGVNDSEDHLNALVSFCDGLLCHVNLLPMNPVEGAPYQPASMQTVNHWTKILMKHGVETSMRKSRGADIDGACGQLKNKLVSRETK